MKHSRTFMTLILLAVRLAFAQAAAPEYINDEGVLRHAIDNPLDGDHDMVFRFYDAESGGALLLTDSHTSTEAASVLEMSVQPLWKWSAGASMICTCRNNGLPRHNW